MSAEGSHSRRTLIVGIIVGVTALVAAPTSTAALRADGAQLVVATPGADHDVSLQNPAIAPDGRTLMYTEYLCGYDAAADGTGSCPESGGGALLARPLAGGTTFSLFGTCNDPSNEPTSCLDEATNVNGLASWSAVNRVAFAISAGNGQIATASATGGGAGFSVVAKSTRATFLEPTFNPSGNQIAFQADQLNAGDFANHASIDTVNSSGAGLTTLIDGPGGTPKSDNRLPVFSPDGRLILFQRRTNFSDQSQPYNLFTIDPVSKALTQVTGAPGQPTFGGNDDSDASWSPDGRWILDSASYYNVGGEPNIWLVSADGKQLVRATTSPREDGAPVMSPDGQWIFFESHVGTDASVSQIWRIASPVRSDGSMEVFRPTTTYPVSAPVPSAQNPCYVPDSKTLLFTEFTDTYNNDGAPSTANPSAILFSIPAAGGNPRTVVSHLGQSAVNLPGTCYSAIAKRITYSSDLPTQHSSTDNIWTAQPTGTNLGEHQVTCYTNADLHAQEPSWSADGKTLVYELASTSHPNTTTLWTIPATNNCGTGFHPTEIVPAPRTCPPVSSAPPSDNHQPNFSPDGTRILFQSSTSDSATTVNLWTVDRNGCHAQQITSGPHTDTDASFSPDSSTIVYSTDLRSTTGIANLFTVRAQPGATPQRLTSQCFTLDGAPSWSPDGRWVSFESWPNPDPSNHENPTSIWRISAAARPPDPTC